MWLTLTVVEDHAMTLTSTPSNHQTQLFFSLIQPSLNTPWLEATAPQSPPLSLETVWLPRCQLVHCQKSTNLRQKKLLRPYQEESTTSRLISEVKPLRAWLVLGLETTWEHQVS